MLPRLRTSIPEEELRSTLLKVVQQGEREKNIDDLLLLSVIIEPHKKSSFINKKYTKNFVLGFCNKQQCSLTWGKGEPKDNASSPHPKSQGDEVMLIEIRKVIGKGCMTKASLGCKLRQFPLETYTFEFFTPFTNYRGLT